MIKSCNPPMSKADLEVKCKCGHLGSEHRRDLPAPCGKGWNQEAIAAAMDAEPELRAKAHAYGEEYQRQLAAGACPCIGFSPGVDHGRV